MSVFLTNGKGDLGLTGTVLAAQANYYHVRLDPVGNAVPPLDTPLNTPLDIEPLDMKLLEMDQSLVTVSDQLLCTRRARLKKMGVEVMVGDRVQIEEPDWTGGRGAIARVFPRASELKRPPVANANQVLLVFALDQPSIDPLQLTRFLVTVEQTSMQVIIGLSKTDLVDPQTVREWCDRLSSWGYDALPMSLTQVKGIEAIQARLRSKLTVLCGPSGVGKSSLINRLMPQVNVRVGTISAKWHKGRHTTRHVELFNLPQGGFLADTPGFNQPEIEASPEELELYFPEIQSLLSTASCQFNNCLHNHEPNCVVRGSWERYEQYLLLLEELSQKDSENHHPKTQETSTKIKHRTSGKVDQELRLEQKRYRRQSRRSQHQSVEDLYSEEFL